MVTTLFSRRKLQVSNTHLVPLQNLPRARRVGAGRRPDGHAPSVASDERHVLLENDEQRKTEQGDLAPVHKKSAPTSSTPWPINGRGRGRAQPNAHPWACRSTNWQIDRAEQSTKTDAVRCQRATNQHTHCRLAPIRSCQSWTQGVSDPFGFDSDPGPHLLLERRQAGCF